MIHAGRKGSSSAQHEADYLQTLTADLSVLIGFIIRNMSPEGKRCRLTMFGFSTAFLEDTFYSNVLILKYEDWEI